MLEPLAPEDRSLSLVGAIGWVCLSILLLALTLDLSAALRPGLARDVVNTTMCASLAFSCVVYAVARLHMPARSAADVLGLRWVHPLVYPLAAATGFATLVAVSWLSGLAEKRWPYSTEELDSLRSAYALVGWKQRVAFALVSTTLGPLVEEALFRGVLFRGLRFSHSRAATVVITAALFALCHLSPRLFVHVLPAGLVLGALRAMSGSLVTPLVAHMVFNGVSTFQLLSGLVSFDPEEASVPTWHGLAGLAGVVVALGLLYVVTQATRKVTVAAAPPAPSSGDPP